MQFIQESLIMQGINSDTGYTLPLTGSDFDLTMQNMPTLPHLSKKPDSRLLDVPPDLQQLNEDPVFASTSGQSLPFRGEGARYLEQFNSLAGTLGTTGIDVLKLRATGPDGDISFLDNDNTYQKDPSINSAAGTGKLTTVYEESQSEFLPMGDFMDGLIKADEEHLPSLSSPRSNSQGYNGYPAGIIKKPLSRRGAVINTENLERYLLKTRQEVSSSLPTDSREHTPELDNLDKEGGSLFPHLEKFSFQQKTSTRSKSPDQNNPAQ
jgi:hypothetical protein